MKKKMMQVAVLCVLMVAVWTNAFSATKVFAEERMAKVIEVSMPSLIAELGGDDMVHKLPGANFVAQTRFKIDGKTVVINSHVWEPSPGAGLYGNSVAYVENDGENIHLVKDIENPLIGFKDADNLTRAKMNYGIEQVYFDSELGIVLTDRQVEIIQNLPDLELDELPASLADV